MILIVPFVLVLRLEGSEMHVFRYYVRGHILFAIGFLIPLVVEYYISEHKQEFPHGLDAWSTFGLFLVGILLIVFSVRQFQYTSRFTRLGDVLKETVVGARQYQFVMLNGDNAVVKRYHGGFRIEVVPYDSFDKTVYVVKHRTMYVHKQVVVGLSESVKPDGSIDTGEVLLESLPLTPDYKDEMKRLIQALESYSSL